MTTQCVLHDWQAANAVLAAHFPNEKLAEALDRLRDEGSASLPVKVKHAFDHRLAAEEEIVSRLVFPWKTFMATRLEQQPHHGLGVEEVLKQLDDHHQRRVAALALSSPVQKIIALLEGPQEEQRSEVLLGLTQSIEEKLDVLARLCPELPSIPAVSEAVAVRGVDGIKGWVEEVKSRAVVPALIASVNQQAELAGFSTYDFQLFLVERVPSGDPRLVEWANESSFSLFHQLNEAAAKPRPVVSLSPRAFRPR